MPRHHVARVTSVSAATLALALVVSGCATESENAGASTGEPVVGGDLTYLEYQPHTSLYPPAGGFYPNGALVNNVTDRLTYQNPETLEIEPWIASDWEVNADATQYTFNLRDGVTFSDGSPLDAEVVAKNFDTYGLGNSELGLTVSEAINNYESSEVVDDDTVVFHFAASAPGFLQATSTINSGLVSSETLDRTFEDFGVGNSTDIIGSGPFVITAENIGTDLTLEARDDYDWAPASLEHQGRAYLDTINLVVTPEDSVRIGALTSGQADYARYVQAFDEEQVESSGITLYAPQTRGVNNSLSIRFTNPLVSDIRVRQALVAGINREEIVETIFTDNYPVASSSLSSSAPGYKDESALLTFDPDKARDLLDEAGWVEGSGGIREKDGVALSLDVYVAAPQPLSQQTLELASQQLADIGVELNVKPADAGSYAADIKDPLKTPLYHSMVGRADLDVIKSQYHTKNRNTLLSNDAHLDELLELVAGEADPDKRLERSADVQDYLAEQAYVIPLFEEPQVYGAAPYVKGIEFESVGRPSFYDVWLDR